MELLESGAASIGITLSDKQVEQFRRFYEELTVWNQKVNLTSVTGLENTQTRHFLDSLTVSGALDKETLEGGSLIDIGSGGGFPGVPLKIAYPLMKVTLVDATSRKTAFLSYLVNDLRLDNVEVLTGRAETLARDAALRESFDVAVSRAVASMSVLCEYMLPFCRIGGFAVAQKGADVADEVAQASGAIEMLGGRLKETAKAATWGQEEERSLVILEKVNATPTRFPRRPGIPAKRPL